MMLSMAKKDHLTAWARSDGSRGATIQSVCAFLLYLTVPLSDFGLPLLGHFGHRFISGHVAPLIEQALPDRFTPEKLRPAADKIIEPGAQPG